METFLAAIGFVFVAELGDKTQLVALGLATRYRLAPVLVGVTIAYVLTQGFAAAIGGLVGATLPIWLVQLAAGIGFLVFALLTLRDKQDGDGTALKGRSIVLSVASLVTVAEFGDKTMLMTAALAARSEPWIVWAGATVGITLSGAVAVVVGHYLGRALPTGVVRKVAAGLFAAFGVLLLVSAVAELTSP